MSHDPGSHRLIMLYYVNIIAGVYESSRDSRGLIPEVSRLGFCSLSF